MNNDKCELCGCEAHLTVHHLIPRLKAKNKYKEIKDDPLNLIWICRSCHDQIHALFDNTQLRDIYNTKDKLLSSDEMQKFIKWKIKHPEFKGHSKMSNERKRKS